MQRHTGGVQGTVLRRGYCPECRRGVAGGICNRAKTEIWLRPHKPPRHQGSDQPSKGVPDCPGSGTVVPIDNDLTMAYAARLRERDRSRLGSARARLTAFVVGPDSGGAPGNASESGEAG